jgi:hypothetical protein
MDGPIRYSFLILECEGHLIMLMVMIMMIRVIIKMIMIIIMEDGGDNNPLMGNLQRMVTIPRKLNMDQLQYHLIQCWTTWFLWKEEVSASDIHRWLRAVCGKAAPDHSIVSR